MNEKISIDFKMTDENKKILDELTKPVGIRHFLIETEFGDKFDVVEYPEYQKLQQENQELKKQLDCALGLLSEMYPPCEKDGFMDKHSDYCELNCGVDEEIFKKCWLMYIKDKVSEVE